MFRFISETVGIVIMEDE